MPIRREGLGRTRYALLIARSLAVPLVAGGLLALVTLVNAPETSSGPPDLLGLLAEATVCTGARYGRPRGTN